MATSEVVCWYILCIYIYTLYGMILFSLIYVDFHWQLCLWKLIYSQLIWGTYLTCFFGIWLSHLFLLVYVSFTDVTGSKVDIWKYRHRGTPYEAGLKAQKSYMGSSWHHSLVILIFPKYSMTPKKLNHSLLMFTVWIRDHFCIWRNTGVFDQKQRGAWKMWCWP